MVTKGLWANFWLTPRLTRMGILQAECIGNCIFGFPGLKYHSIAIAWGGVFTDLSASHRYPIS